jgi:hypothetical protein
MDPAHLDLLDRIVRYSSPFLAAGLASVLTYVTVGRQKRMDVLTTERLGAFKAVQSALVGLKHYCEGAAGELEGGDFSRRVEDLPSAIPRSALTQGEALRGVIDGSQIFFSKQARKELESLVQQVYLLENMELAASYGTIRRKP